MLRRLELVSTTGHCELDSVSTHVDLNDTASPTTAGSTSQQVTSNRPRPMRGTQSLIHVLKGETDRSERMQ